MTLTDLHFAVQLWEGGPYWATTNIGATSSADYGYYFAWGYTDACVRNSADDGWVLASDGTTQKQFNASYFSNRDASTYEDAASTKWGNGWSVPTKSNLEDLINTSNTTTEWVLSGSRGMKVTGKGDYASNSIFLPSPGYGTDGQNIVLVA